MTDNGWSYTHNNSLRELLQARQIKHLRTQAYRPQTNGKVERSSYVPGTFCWVDLTTPDQAGAKAFYMALFGWEADDRPAGDGVFYSMMLTGGKLVCAISPQPQVQRDAGAPPAWSSYVAVVDADAIAARAVELGATVHAEPFDVFDAGRMAVIQDPQGAYILIWQPKEHHGAQLVNAPGAFAWNELASPDLDASASFYGDLFGWKITEMQGMPMRYLVINNGERSNGGITELQPPAPAHWLVYFAVAEIDAGLATVEQLGGRKLAGPIDIGVAKIAVVVDPQGAVFALYAGQLED
jgi:predicted enzyme related to lactoylglutathione lyase